MWVFNLLFFYNVLSYLPLPVLAMALQTFRKDHDKECRSDDTEGAYLETKKAQRLISNLSDSLNL